MTVKTVNEMTVFQQELGRVCPHENEQLKRSTRGNQPKAGTLFSAHRQGYGLTQHVDTELIQSSLNATDHFPHRNL